MYKILSELIQAHYYKDRAECMNTVNTMFTGKALLPDEYMQLVTLTDACYCEIISEIPADLNSANDLPSEKGK